MIHNAQDSLRGEEMSSFVVLVLDKKATGNRIGIFVTGLAAAKPFPHGIVGSERSRRPHVFPHVYMLFQYSTP